jgi:hypothetical protein
MKEKYLVAGLIDLQRANQHQFSFDSLNEQLTVKKNWQHDNPLQFAAEIIQ